MKKPLASLKDIFISGLIFLMPLFIVIVVVVKVFMLFKNTISATAELFGLKGIAGIPAPVIAGIISFILICLVCGILMRLVLIRHLNKWVDNTLSKMFPLYKSYRQLAIQKLQKQDDNLLYESAAWIKAEKGVLQPAFVIETLENGKLVMFIPTGGNIKQGAVLLMDQELVERSNTDTKLFQDALSNFGFGISKMQ